MAWKQQSNPFGEPVDASLGLILRLNVLWTRVDNAAAQGDFDKWNSLLDRVFCNLLYREELTSVKTADGKIKSVKLSENDQALYNILNQSVVRAKLNLALAKSKSDYLKYKEDLYKALMMKDVGLKKFQQKLKIYYKEKDSNPSRAMWGG